MKIKSLLVFIVTIWFGTAMSGQNLSPVKGKSPVNVAAMQQSVSTLADNEAKIILGYCPDEISENASAIGVIDQSASMAAAVRFPAAKMAGLAGNKITQIRFGINEGLTNVYVWLRTGSLTSTPLILKKIEAPVGGWNEVILDTPYEIDGSEVYVGYNAKQPIGVSGVLLDGKENENATFLSTNYIWEDFYGKGWGSLCIQAVAEGNKLPQFDLSLDKFASDKSYYKPEETLVLSATVKNEGMKTIEGYTVSCQLDGGTPISETINQPLEANASIKFTKELPLSEYTEGIHPVKIYLSNIVGGKDEIAVNDTIEGTFGVYTSNYPRKILLEQFTTLQCVNCPNGAKSLLSAIGERNDIVWVAHHVGYKTDEFTIGESGDYLDFGVSGAPSAMLDRTHIPDNTDSAFPPFGIGYENSSYGGKIINKFIDYCAGIPAFVTISLNGTYNEGNKELKLDITGECNGIFKEFFPESNVTVFLTEDGLLGKRAQSGATINYIHNHVLRAILTDTFGDAISWDGNRFNCTKTVTLNESWTPENMKAIAVVNKPFNTTSISPNNAEVLNSAEIKISGQTSIESATADEIHIYAANHKIMANGECDELTVYTPAGTQVHNESLPAGLYLVKVVSGHSVVTRKITMD